MYTVKTLRTEGSDVPQISIGYHEEKHETSVIPDDPVETVAPIVADEDEPVAYQTGERCVSLLTSIGDGCIQGSGASIITYENIPYALGENNATALPAEAVINEDDTFVSFENITYNTNLVESAGSGVQKYMIIPLSQAACDVDSRDSNSELQTAVDTIRNPVDNDSQESILLTGAHHHDAALHPVQIGANGAIHIVTNAENKATAVDIDTSSYKKLNGSEISGKKYKTSQERKPSVNHLHKFSSSELVEIGKSEKDILVDYLENTKGKRGRPKRELVNNTSDQSVTRLVDKTSEDVCDRTTSQTCVDSKYDGATNVAPSYFESTHVDVDPVYPVCNDRHIDDETSQNCTHLNTHDSLHEGDACDTKHESVSIDPAMLVQFNLKETNIKNIESGKSAGACKVEESGMNEEIDATVKDCQVGKNDIVMSVKEKKETVTVRKSSRKRNANGKPHLEAKYVKRKKHKSETEQNRSEKNLQNTGKRKSENRLEFEGQNKTEEDEVEIVSEDRLDPDFYKVAIYRDKYVIKLAPITMKTIKTKEIIIEVEVADDLKVKEFSHIGCSAGLSKYALSVIKPSLKLSETNSGSLEDCLEKSKSKHVVNRRAKSTAQNNCNVKGSAPRKKIRKLEVPCSDDNVDENPEATTRNVVSETFTNTDANKTDCLVNITEDVDSIERECADHTVAAHDYKVDPLSVITASLGIPSKCSTDYNQAENIVELGKTDSDLKNQISTAATEDSPTTSSERKGRPGQTETNTKSYTTVITEDGTKEYGCPLCGHTSKYSQNILMHIAEHSDAKDFVCEECGTRWKSKNRLSKHMIVHKKDRPYTCPLCPQSFKSRPILKQHINRHLGVKKFICEYCSKGFVTKGDMAKHIRCHTGTTPYQCETCQKRFADVSSLYRHIRDKHVVDKRFMCSVCEKRYGRRDAIFKHVKKAHIDVIRFTDNERVALWVIDLNPEAGP